MYNIVKQTITKIGRFRIHMEQIEKDGALRPFSYVEIKPGVTIVPFIDAHHILLVKEYRHPIKTWEFEFPSGMIDDGEKPVEAACRELMEETGYNADRLVDLGSYYPSFGSTDEKVHLFACKAVPCGERIKEEENYINREPLEEIEKCVLKIDDFEDLISDGAFQHGGGLIAWYKIKEYCSRVSDKNVVDYSIFG